MQKEEGRNRLIFTQFGFDYPLGDDQPTWIHRRSLNPHPHVGTRRKHFGIFA